MRVRRSTTWLSAAHAAMQVHSGQPAAQRAVWAGAEAAAATATAVGGRSSAGLRFARQLDIMLCNVDGRGMYRALGLPHNLVSNLDVIFRYGILA